MLLKRFEYIEQELNKVKKRLELFHLPGKHDQKLHGKGGGGGVNDKQETGVLKRKQAAGTYKVQTGGLSSSDAKQFEQEISDVVTELNSNTVIREMLDRDPLRRIVSGLEKGDEEEELDVLASYNPGTTWISVAYDKVKEGSKEVGVDKGRFGIGDGIESVLKHEIGHHIHTTNPDLMRSFTFIKLEGVKGDLFIKGGKLNPEVYAYHIISWRPWYMV